MTIDVKQRHIDMGLPKDACRCPVACAIEEATRSVVFVTNTGLIMGLLGPQKFPIPPEVLAFIKAFDAGQHVEPFSFEI